MGRAIEATETGRNGNRWKIFHSTSALGSIFREDVGTKEIPGCLHSFVFPSGTSKNKVKYNNIKPEKIRIDQLSRHHIGRKYW